MTTKRSLYACVFLSLFVAGATPVAGQSLWGELSTIGYGGLGVGAGVVLSGDDLYAFDPKILVGAGLGMALGYAIGGRAEDMVQQGFDLPTPILWGVRLGTVTGFTATGVGLAGMYVAGTEGNETGDDERVFRIGAILGALGGVILQASIESGNGVSELRRAPALSVAPSPAGGISFGSTLRVW